MTIEDCLDIAIGNNCDFDKFLLEKSDVSLLYSLGSQISKGTALTDRQLYLLQTKLLKYADQFDHAGINIDEAKDTLRMPLRSIDRSKFVKIKDDRIVIRFPFTKKLILLIEDIKKTIGSDDHFHQKGSHIHTFAYNENTVYHIVSNFVNKDFEIDDKLLNDYKQLQDIVQNSHLHIPGIYNFKIKNCHKNTKNYITNKLGNPNIDNLALFKDRQKLYGLKYFDRADLNKSMSKYNTLSQKIINRSKFKVYLNSTEWTFDNITESLLELERFPILIIFNKNSKNAIIDDLSYAQQSLKNVIDNKDVSVLFRMDNSQPENIYFNEYIQHNNLNNPVAENTKVVYISNDNIPKPLLISGWKPLTVISMGCFNDPQKVKFYLQNYDLTIYYDEQISPMMNYARTDSYQEGIQKI